METPCPLCFICKKGQNLKSIKICCGLLLFHEECFINHCTNLHCSKCKKDLSDNFTITKLTSTKVDWKKVGWGIFILVYTSVFVSGLVMLSLLKEHTSLTAVFALIMLLSIITTRSNLSYTYQKPIAKGICYLNYAFLLTSVLGTPCITLVASTILYMHPSTLSTNTVVLLCIICTSVGICGSIFLIFSWLLYRGFQVIRHYWSTTIVQVTNTTVCQFNTNIHVNDFTNSANKILDDIVVTDI